MPPVISVLIVDDEPSVRSLMARWVESLGMRPETAANAEEAVERLKREHCDLAVIDIMMPGRNGLWLAGELRRSHPHTAVILSTGNPASLDGDPEGVADFLIKPFQRERFVLAVDRGTHWRREATDEIEWHARLTAELHDRLADVKNTLQNARAVGRPEAEVLLALATSRVPDVVAHSQRVARYTMAIAREMDLDRALWPAIERAAIYHDIGKLVTPEAVLTKPSPLTLCEIALMRRHVDAGAEILDSTESLRDIAPAVLASHEWFEGNGYPNRLAGDAIPLASRVIAVADAYDAMTQDRVYRSRLDTAEALAELLRSTPQQFDPNVILAFLDVLSHH